MYHINAVDEVTQWQVVGATAHISEAWLMPVLEAMLAQFHFEFAAFTAITSASSSITRLPVC